MVWTIHYRGSNKHTIASVAGLMRVISNLGRAGGVIVFVLAAALILLARQSYGTLSLVLNIAAFFFVVIGLAMFFIKQPEADDLADDCETYTSPDALVAALQHQPMPYMVCTKCNLVGNVLYQECPQCLGQANLIRVEYEGDAQMVKSALDL